MISFRSIVSGSSGNSALFSCNHTNILIDCGISGKQLTAYLNDMGLHPSDLDGVFITHEHIDHTRGAGVLARSFRVPVIASQGTLDAMNAGTLPNTIVLNGYEPVQIGDVTIHPFPIPHDAAQPTGCRLEAGGKSVVVATDMGHITDAVRRAAAGCNAAIIEANYDLHLLQNGSYPYPLKKRIGSKQGHLDNRDTGVLASYLAENGTEHIILGHLSRENNSPELAFAAVAQELEFHEVAVGRDVLLSVAPRYSLGTCVNL